MTMSAGTHVDDEFESKLVLRDVHTSVAVARVGDALGHTLHQELAAVVGVTAARERLRRSLIVALTVCGSALLGLGRYAETISIGVYGALCILPVLPLMLAWGVRNRALLNAAAANAAVDHVALARAVRLVRKGRLGPSSALRLALREGGRP